MDSRFTVFFDDPFWVGVAEVVDGQSMRIARFVFGGNEPGAADVYDFVITRYSQLRFDEVEVEPEIVRPKDVSPKRQKRLINREVRRNGTGTKSQEALKRVMESRKIEIKAEEKIKTLEARQRKYELKRQKKLDKKRGH